ncbi:MAG: fumarylacetoacetate hydrolase family protein [Actinomycetota bacterium]
MKIANINGRASLIMDDQALDIAKASAGAFGPSLQSVYDNFDAFTSAAPQFPHDGLESYSQSDLGSPAPEPRQVFAIGLNYHAHAAEAGMAVPTVPAAFTKFPSSLGGPFEPVPRMGETLDWEVEIVAVISRHAYRVPEADAWDYVAGLAVGQDYSERTMQFAAGSQFSLGKSYPGFGPVGPWLTTLDDIADRDNLPLECWINDDKVQDAPSTDMVFSIPSLIAQLSAVTPLWPGDLLFTGTPAGVGITAQPPRFLQIGDVVRSTIGELGSIHNTVVAPV